MTSATNAAPIRPIGLAVVFAAMVLLFCIPLLVARARRTRGRSGIAVLCVGGVGAAGAFFAAVVLLPPNEAVWAYAFLGVILLTSAAWVAALIWSLVGESALAPDRPGFAVLPAGQFGDPHRPTAGPPPPPPPPHGHA